MKLSQVLLGASRMPLTPKRGNKDFYKGTGQSYAPGGGHRTGPPGKHVVGGKAKFRVMDDKVRYFVGPGRDVLEKTDLRPYVAREIQPPPKGTRHNVLNPHLPFSPNITHAPIMTTHSHTGEPLKIDKHDHKAFSKWYRALSHEERTQVIAETRRQWYANVVQDKEGQLFAKSDGAQA